MYLIKVILEYKNINLDKTFDYYSTDKVALYSRVLVPFNNKEIVGFVIEVKEEGKSEYAMKEIIEIIDKKPILNDELYKLAEFMQNKYLSSRIQALQTMLPPGLKPLSKQKKEVIYDLYLEIKESNEQLTSKQSEVLNKIKEEKNLKNSIISKKYGAHMINALYKKGYLNKVNKKREMIIIDKETSEFIELTSFQQEIYQKVINSDKKVSLLHGITGSGKTEIYLHLARHYLNKGKSVLVLVPEITLTLMMQDKFASHFKNEIAILHSRLSNAQRYQEYQKINEGKVKIVVGTRSSIFAPLKNIGIIIVDEEHDSSYKQSSGLMYHTNDIVVERASYHQAQVLLASATPSINSLTKAYQKQYQYLVLNKRFFNQPLPNVEIVDLNYEKITQIVSDKVIKKIKTTLSNNKQVIVLLNRRGYNTMIQCRDCQKTLMCPHCNVALTYHHSNKTLVCHHCAYSTKTINHCFYCGSTNLKRLGFGTQRVEEYLSNCFSEYNVTRIDQDAIKNIKQLEKCINDFKEKKSNILIGTQMIAKGLDFESADLVVVLNIDASLAFNSYDAIESAFTLLVQVSGRSGRHSGKGEVMIETFQPDHYVIKKAQQHDYLGFYELEMKQRKKFDNPPYYKIALLLISGEDENKIVKEANSIYEYLNESLKKVIVYNNIDAPIYKLANRYRQQIMIKYKRIEDIKDEMLRLKKSYGSKKGISLTIDIDY
ncbi:primosomal protein N' (replication factor Y) [Bacilli bacterium PM5-9]|nr:primosomal protein N' (replication factor Y) [Bacilli bacterium PM5-9]